MKITKPQIEIEVCDLCGREAGYLLECTTCGKQYCLTCEGIVPKSWGYTNLCRKCSGRNDVKAVCQKYAEQLTPIFGNRNAALKRLRKKAAAAAGGEE